MNKSFGRAIVGLFFFSLALLCVSQKMENKLYRAPKPLGLMRPNDSESEPSFVDDWREVPKSEGKWYVYSAHLYRAPDGEPCLSMVTLVSSDLKIQAAFCHVWNSTNSFATFKGNLIFHGGRKQFTSLLVRCPLIHDGLGAPLRAAVTQSENTDLNFTDAMPVNPSLKKLDEDAYTDAKFQPRQESQIDASSNVTHLPKDTFKSRYDGYRHENASETLALCVRPIFNAYNEAARIIEFIELHKILGVQFFFFYNYSIGPDVDKVLRYYVRKGDAVVVPWSLPLHVYRGVHMVGQLSSQEDCHMRASGFSLVAMWDLDEFIIPRETTDLVEMVKGMEYHASYLFKNVFFYTCCEDDPTFVPQNITSEVLKPCPPVRDELNSGLDSDAAGLEPRKCIRNEDCTSNSDNLKEEVKGDFYIDKICSQEIGGSLITPKKSRRITIPQPHFIRSKFIMRPLHVALPTVHLVQLFQDDVPVDKRVYFVPANIALSHHYRDHRGRNTKFCAPNYTMTDRTALRYATELRSSVAEILRQMCSSKRPC